MTEKKVSHIISSLSIPDFLKDIAGKIIFGERINAQEGLVLYEKATLSYLALLATVVREKKHGCQTFFIENCHIEPTNCCVHLCKFCSFNSEHLGNMWDLAIDQIVSLVKEIKYPFSEIHITGGVHPDRDVYYYAELLKQIKAIRPTVHLKAFSADELIYMIKKSGLSIQEGLKILKENGLNSIPGGGAEIFDASVRKQICNNKSTASEWLAIHKTAHEIGIRSNATMLYGHIESYAHRIQHLELLRNLQDETRGFNAFIPLKFRNKNNLLNHIQEVSIVEDLKNYAVARIFLDNIEHIKAYWPMLGKQQAQLALSFGADDIDGTINDSTKIYSAAGVDEKNPVSMSKDELIQLIKQARFTPVERDSNYNKIKNYE